MPMVGANNQTALFSCRGYCLKLRFLELILKGDDINLYSNLANHTKYFLILHIKGIETFENHDSVV